MATMSQIFGSLQKQSLKMLIQTETFMTGEGGSSIAVLKCSAPNSILLYALEKLYEYVFQTSNMCKSIFRPFLELQDVAMLWSLVEDPVNVNAGIRNIKFKQIT